MAVDEGSECEVPNMSNIADISRKSWGGQAWGKMSWHKSEPKFTLPNRVHRIFRIARAASFSVTETDYTITQTPASEPSAALSQQSITFLTLVDSVFQRLSQN